MTANACTARGTKFRNINLSRCSARCPVCGAASGRHSNARRRLREIGVAGPTVIVVTYSKYYCEACRKHFSTPMDHLAPKTARFTHRVRRTAVDLVTRDALTLEKAALRMRQKHFVTVPSSTLHDWVRDAMTV